MLMSELIEQYRANPGGPTETLVRALAKTGPLIHKGTTYSGSVDGGKYSLSFLSHSSAAVRPAEEIDVPAGSFPGVDPDQDALRGFAIALKANSSRVLSLIDTALDTTAGEGGLLGIIAALKAVQTSSGDMTVDGFMALKQALDTVGQARQEIEGMTAE